MKAINQYIIIEKIKEEPKKVNGLILSDSENSDVRYLKGKVISAGNKTEGVKDGDVIYYDRHAGHRSRHWQMGPPILSATGAVSGSSQKPRKAGTNRSRSDSRRN